MRRYINFGFVRLKWNIQIVTFCYNDNIVLILEITSLELK